MPRASPRCTRPLWARSTFVLYSHRRPRFRASRHPDWSSTLDAEKSSRTVRRFPHRHQFRAYCMRRSSAHIIPLLALLALALSSLACSAGDLLERRPEPPPPTRTPAPTFTPGDEASQLVIVTPPAQTPGVIVVPPGLDPRTLIPLPPTATWTPSVMPEPTLPATDTSTPESLLPSPTPPTRTPLPRQVVVPPPTFPPLIPVPRSPLLTPTPSPTPPPTSTPTTTPTPYVLVESGLVSLRSGPGVAYPLVAQLGPGIPVAVVGRNPEGAWLQICCVNGDSVWVAQSHVQVINDASGAILVLSDSPPTATITSTPTETPTITPTPTATPYPFQVSEGPLFFPTNNELFSIWASISAPGPDGGVPLAGYYVRVQFRDRDDRATFDDRPNTKGERPSTDRWEYSVPPGTASGNRVRFNYKFEFIAPDPKEEDPFTTETRLTLIDGFWRMYVVDGNGTQLSAPVEFNTLLGNNNREIFIGWMRRP